jgi:uncharacterized protein YndB with AHSA1/START domain
MGEAATLDPRPGGIYSVQMGNGWTVLGEYVEVDPPRRVVFTWGWEDGVEVPPPGASTVEITLTPDGEATVVRVVHRGLPTEESAASHRSGWQRFLPQLAAVASGREPGPDPTKEAVQ